MIDATIDKEPGGPNGSSAGGSTSHPHEHGIPADDASEQSAPQPTDLWKGWAGLSIMLLGVLAPALIVSVTGFVCFERICRLAFRHPLETLLECVFIAAVPLANYLAWHAVVFKDKCHSLRLGLLNGAAIGTSAIASILAFASLIFGYPSEFFMLSAIAAGACASAIYLASKLPQIAETRTSQTRRLIYTVIGLALSLVGFAASEGKSAAIRYAEHLAISKTPRDHRAGIKWLRLLNCEQELRMQCADDRTAGIPGIFFRITADAERQLYFEVVGKPYGNSLTQSVYSMPDDYLQTHVVGAAIPGLSLLRSAYSGNVHPETLTSTINWTFVFSNTTYNQQEARAEIALPPGAVVSNLTLWAQGEPHNASFGATDKIQHDRWVNLSEQDPALITDLGRGRVLLKCRPIPPQGEMKVMVAVTHKLKPELLKQATLTLPNFVHTNFDIETIGEHTLRLVSNQAMTTAHEGLRPGSTADGGVLLSGALKPEALKGMPITVSVTRPPVRGPFAVKDQSTDDAEGYVVARVDQISSQAPDSLVVVVDTSLKMKEHKDRIAAALSSIPKEVKTSILLVGDDSAEPLALAEGLEKMKKMEFEGGKDNLRAVIKATEIAGETKHGALLWIHGPQPSYNQEIYIMAPFAAKPRFFELALDEGFTDGNEFFKNHREIGPFNPVPRASNIDDDLKTFVSKWQPGGVEYTLSLTRMMQKPNCQILSGRQALELTKLAVRDECLQLIRDNRLVEAAEVASHARLVTPVSAAVVLGKDAFAAQNDAVRMAQQQGAYNNSNLSSADSGSQTGDVDGANSPTLTGATNGSIGPQAGDATVIEGVNTAGTVRVNNLANLEALLNIIANISEIFGICAATCLAGKSMFGTGIKIPIPLNRTQTLVAALIVAVCSLGIPGMINWMVCSARDANLFS